MHYQNFVIKEDKIRNCQLGAYWATLSHFTKSDMPALISLPTGAGKTELMQLLSFGLKAQRVLIVTPSQLLKDELYERFRELSLLKKLEIINNSVPNPKVRKLGKKLKLSTDWDSLKKYDVVITTPINISSSYKDVSKPFLDLFDVIFIDEAHHVEAKTWNQIVDDFPTSKKIFLTATPFRNDHRKIKAELIYHYPIKRAVEDGIYQKIEFIPVEDDKHESLAEKVNYVKNLLESNGEKAKILVRSKHVNEASEIIKIYEKFGIRIKEINYKKSKQNNKKVLEEIRNGDIDGIVCVGMVGEGIDIPDLNVLVFHFIPESFQLTIQFIGRVSRTTQHKSQSFVIAERNKFRVHFRSLHQNEKGWESLIDNIEEAIGFEMSKVFDSKFFDKRLYKEYLKPFFNVTIYECSKDKLNFDEGIKINHSNLKVEYVKYESSENVLLLITLHEETPLWAIETPIRETKYNLHIYYYDTKSELLFECTTLPWISRLILKKIVSGKLEVISYRKLINVVKESEIIDYITLGMRNALGLSFKNPSYKSHVGQNVQLSILPSDEKFFSVGHALTRDIDQKYLGISIDKGKIWSLKRGSIDSLISWCKERGLNIVTNSNKKGLPMLEKLLFPQEIFEIPDEPLAITLDEYQMDEFFEIRLDKKKTFELKYPQFVIDTFDKDTKEIICGLKLSEAEVIEALKYSIRDGWRVPNTQNCTVYYRGDELSLEEFLNLNPPKIYLKNGMITRNLYYEIISKHEISDFDKIYRKLGWDGCQVKYETRIKITSDKKRKIRSRKELKWKTPIIEWLSGYISCKLKKGSFLFQDDGKNEIADLVCFDSNRKEVTFYHCKGQVYQAESPGARLEDFNVVVAQAVRSTYWVNNKNLVNEIMERLGEGKGKRKKRKSSIIKYGSIEVIKEISRNFNINEWRFRIVIVQPWGKKEEIKKSKSLQNLLSSANQWINSSESDFLIIGR
jgi:superfamily II DNA or RNA helicase